MKGKLLNEPRFYIYKIEFETGETYIGSHIEYKTNDGYICSSIYWKRHPELKLKSREILFYLPTLEQMNVMETICIISDKCNSPKNINGNYGNWLYNFHSELDCPWNKGLKMSEEFCKKMSLAMSEPIVCIETLEVFNNSQGLGHIGNATNGLRKSCNGMHYRKITKKEKENILSGEIEYTIQLNKQYLIELYADKEYYYCVENNIAWDSLEVVARMMSETPKMFRDRIGKTYKGLTFVIVDSCFVFGNSIKVISLEKPKKTLNKKIRCIETGEIFESVKEASKKYKGHISSVLTGSRKTANGYHWEYV